MKKLIGLTLVLFSLGFGFAQPNASSYYAGGLLGIGFPGAAGLSVTTFGLTGYFGASDLLTDNLDVRGGLSFGFGSVAGVSASFFRLAADAIYNIELGPDVPITPHAGGGLRFGRLAGGGEGAGGFGVGFLAGARYPFSAQLSGVAELSFDVYFGQITVTHPALAVGIRYSF